MNKEQMRDHFQRGKDLATRLREFAASGGDDEIAQLAREVEDIQERQLASLKGSVLIECDDASR